MNMIDMIKFIMSIMGSCLLDTSVGRVGQSFPPASSLAAAVARAAEALRRGVKWITDKARIHRPPQAGEVITN